MLTKKISKRMGMISFTLTALITVLGLGVAVYATQQSKMQEAVATLAPVEQQINEGQEVQEEVTPEEEEEYLKYLDEEEEKKEEPKEPSSLPYYIKVNYRAQTVTVYGKDANGEYTNPVIAFICSTGTDTPTSGVYPIRAKYRWVNLKGNVYGQYSSRIVGSILFHSVYYYEKFNPSTLCYTGYDKLGSKASAGCVRLNVAAAKWIYDNCPVGTKVEFYASSNPGPLGKPSSPKISGNLTCRGWDPTDPDPSNPWHTYVEPTPEPTPTPQPEVSTQPEPAPEISLKNVESISLEDMELMEKTTRQIQVIINPQNADIATIEWKVADPQIVTIVGNGKQVTLKGEKTGTTTITVKVTDKNGNQRTATGNIIVKAEEKMDNNTVEVNEVIM